MDSWFWRMVRQWNKRRGADKRGVGMRRAAHSRRRLEALRVVKRR
jgi:hypothetical protein